MTKNQTIALHHGVNDLDATPMARELRGGSEAVTTIIQVGSEKRLRKYAFGDAATKLREQYLWLDKYKTRLPLVRVIEKQTANNWFSYDMPCSITSQIFYDYIHENPLDLSWPILSGILDTMRAFHEENHAGTASAAMIENYIERKVSENFQIIRNVFPQMFENDILVVNGQEIHLSLIQRFATKEYLVPRLKLRATAAIHGDLTIENIIIDPASTKGWFLIDPNTGNLMDSPLLDYAKILQSLHLGYEILSRDKVCRHTGNSIGFFAGKSSEYETLHENSSTWIRNRFDEETYREIRLHEIVHYFRLIPYKVRKSPNIGLLFFGCLCLLINQYYEEFHRK